MKYAPAPYGPYWTPPGTEKFVGPPYARGREALLARHRRTVAIIRDPKAPRNHLTHPVEKWERRWITECMKPLGIEGSIYTAWRRLRNLWVAAGCPKGLTPWALMEDRV